jgi:putative transposase
MKHHQNLSPDRKFIRLVGYDYRLPGVYFVSIVTWQRECLFGNVVEGKMRLNSVGKIVQSEWKNLEHRFPYIRTDASIVMPNHIHGIIIIDSKFSEGATQPTKLDNKEIKISVVEPIVDGLSGSPEIGMVVQKARATRHTANVLTDNGAT